jgi:polysaccharide export outer membrane protein
LAVVLFCFGIVLVAGCATLESPDQAAGHDVAPLGPLLLAPGDDVEVSFIGAPELNAAQKVRRDGSISLPILGDVLVSGMTVEGLKKTLTDQYAKDLKVQIITVVARSQAAVFVSGAVLKPGRVEMKRVLTALDAVMEAGGFDSDIADSAHVVVIRQTDTARRCFTLNLAAILEGKGVKSFYLEPNDIVHVPKRRPWF